MLDRSVSEQELSERCKCQDNIARKILYERYAGQMLVVCMRYVSEKEIAQDLLHDGFLKIYQSFDKFSYRGEGSLKAWMSRVFVNLAIEHLRKSETLNRMLTLEEVPDTIADVMENEVECIPERTLMQFISELPVGYRTVFNLYVFEEKSHKEIAATLGINENSSASQLFRAKAVLARRIKSYLDNA